MNPGLESSILLEEVTGLNRTSLLRDISRVASSTESSLAMALLERRLAGEPIQYIVQTAWFYGREFYVDPRVLIPRPETELLVELSLLILPMRRNGAPGPRIADIGTGSGILAITLALECERASLVGTDVSQDALLVAAKNADYHGVRESTRFVRCDGLSALSGVFDLIVSNPPYVRMSDIPALQHEVRDHEPRVALDGGEDGLDIVRRLIQQAETRLASNGTLLVEIGIGQVEEVVRELRSSGRWRDVRAVDDLAGVPRVVCARSAAS